METTTLLIVIAEALAQEDGSDSPLALEFVCWTAHMVPGPPLLITLA